MKKSSKKLIGILIVILLACIYYHSGNQYPFIRILDFYHFTDCGASGVLYMEKASWKR